MSMDINHLKKVKLLLRIGGFGIFFGHGVVAFQGNEAWIPLLTTFGFSVETAISLLPIIGAIDIVVAFLILFLPLKVILIWATFWAFATALSRPIAGLSIWAFIERAGNWVVPISLLIMHGLPKKIKDLFKV
jgi:hypothetical protein